jgi:hypothetical protein
LGIWFGKALEALEKAARAPELHVPIFIALDEKSKKNLGHNVGGLKKAAVWSASISKKQQEADRRSESERGFRNAYRHGKTRVCQKK